MTEPAAVAPDERPLMPSSLLTLLAVAALCVSVSLNVALLQQIALVAKQREQLAGQIGAVPKLRQNASELLSLVQDVARFSVDHPDVLPVLTKYGYSIVGTPR
jgi:hypothetical protein